MCPFKFTKNYDFKLVTEHRFQLTFGGKTVTISIKARQFSKVPSKLIFAQRVLKKIQQPSLAYDIVFINKRMTYISNELLASEHDCAFERYTHDMDLPKKRLAAHCLRSTVPCIVKGPYLFYIYCTKKSHRLFGKPQYHFKLFVKFGPASLNSLCVNKISEFTFYPIPLWKRKQIKCKKQICIKI